MSDNIDHLDPANWWPLFDPDLNRRAIPLFCAQLPCSRYRYHNGTWEGIAGVDAAGSGRMSFEIVAGNVSSGDEDRAPIDTLVYLPEIEFRRHKGTILDRLPLLYDALWDLCRASKITRQEFETRADALRELRDAWSRL